MKEDGLTPAAELPLPDPRAAKPLVPPKTARRPAASVYIEAAAANATAASVQVTTSSARIDRRQQRSANCPITICSAVAAAGARPGFRLRSDATAAVFTRGGRWRPQRRVWWFGGVGTWPAIQEKV